MNDPTKSHRQERPDGMILYRPARNGPTYVLSMEQDAGIRKLVLWQVVVGVAAGFPIMLAILSWLSGDLDLLTLLACMCALLAVATPVGIRLEHRRKNIIRRAPVSDTQIELPEVRHQLARLWSAMPARHRFALRAAPFLMLFSSGIIVLGHLFGRFPERPPLSPTQSVAFFVLSIPFCWLVIRTRSGRAPSAKA